MNCFNHHNVPAVAICKNCNKGICPDCLTEVENGMACSATCVDEVVAINKMIINNRKIMSRARGNYNRTIFIYLSLGLLFLLTGFVYREMEFYMFTAGGLFVFIGVLTYFSSRKLKKEQE